jgi:Holliday junction resolvase
MIAECSGNGLIVSEKKLQAKILKYLHKNGWYAEKQEQTKNGTPDIFALKNGKCLFIEVKSKGKTPTKLQLYQMERLRDFGAICIWVDDCASFSVCMKELRI